MSPRDRKGDSPHLPERPGGCFAQMGTVPFSRGSDPARRSDRFPAGVFCDGAFGVPAPYWDVETRGRIALAAGGGAGRHCGGLLALVFWRAAGRSEPAAMVDDGRGPGGCRDRCWFARVGLRPRYGRVAAAADGLTHWSSTTAKRSSGCWPSDGVLLALVGLAAVAAPGSRGVSPMARVAVPLASNWPAFPQLVRLATGSDMRKAPVGTRCGGSTSSFVVDPLILVLTWLAAHAVPLVLLWSLGVIAATILLGRVFCGWVCPLGTIHAAASHLLRPAKPAHADRDHWSPWQRTKYYVLIGLLVMAVFGVHWGAVFDPLVWLYRTTTAAIVPAAWWSVEDPWIAAAPADASGEPSSLAAGD